MPFRDRHIEHFKVLAAQRVPRVMSALAWIMALGLIGIGCFMTFVPWVQTTAGFGTVTALNPNDRLQEINALVPGRIQEWYVRDGSPVSVGDPIVRIADIDPQLIDRLQSERTQVIAKLTAAETAVSTAEIDLERTRALFEDGLAARREFEQARIRVEELRATEAEAAAELTRVDVNLSRQSVQIVRAPRDGVILRVFAGDAATFVQAGDVVATFVPNQVERAVELYLDGRDVALVRPGAKVRLQFEGWPAVQFSGWPSVAVGTFPGEVVAVDPSAQASGRFRVLVVEDQVEGDVPWPDDRFVRFGASARGWVLLETVPVGYEVWRQLNNFPPRLPETQTTAANN
ncbi:MAG: HlyD family efflux transporter periplasmic adaptor subunit [Pseudomonadota bacterium]